MGVYLIDLKEGTDLPERVVVGKDAKVEAQPCGSTEWVPLQGVELTLGMHLGLCHTTEGCPYEAYTVLKKDKRKVVLEKSGREMNVNVVAFDTHLIRITGNYEIKEAHPWCIQCQCFHDQSQPHRRPAKSSS